mmetsp:Transcript_12767/g.40771  ORF Transcript_12767/g.40771 Transcript_12767/m.40771 type:complete len:206 (+) Transcript_12767:386-1003(+)
MRIGGTRTSRGCSGQRAGAFGGLRRLRRPRWSPRTCRRFIVDHGAAAEKPRQQHVVRVHGEGVEGRRQARVRQLRCRRDVRQSLVHDGNNVGSRLLLHSAKPDTHCHALDEADCRAHRVLRGPADQELGRSPCRACLLHLGGCQRDRQQVCRGHLGRSSLDIHVHDTNGRQRETRQLVSRAVLAAEDEWHPGGRHLDPDPHGAHP